MRSNLKRAFTLVELIVVTALLGVILTALVIIIKPTQKHYNNITNRAQEENVCITATDVIDGELRYATAIQMVYTKKNYKTNAGEDVWSVVDAAKYPNYFHLSNNERETIGEFKARGYAEKGKTSAKKAVSSVVNRDLFHDFDFQFSLAGINTSSGQQSLTIKIDATPMIARANNVERDEDRTHTFEETFKLINLRNKAKLGGNILGMNLPAEQYSQYVDEAADEFGEIWIFYAMPGDVASSGGVEDAGGFYEGTLEFEGAYDPLVPDLYINGEGENTDVFGTIYFVACDDGYKGGYHTNFVGTTDAYMQLSPTYNVITETKPNIACGYNIRVRFSDNSGKIHITATDSGDEFVADIDLTLFETYPKIWIYNKTVCYTDPDEAPADAYDVTVHYISKIGDSYGGVNFYGAVSGHKVKVDGGSPGFVSCSGDKDIGVVLYDEESVITVEAGRGTTASGETKTLTHGGPREIWIYDGKIYENPDDLPGIVPPLYFHYLTDPYDQQHGFMIQSSKPGEATANGANLGANADPIRGDGNFDVTVNLNEDVTIYLYTMDNASIGSVSWDATVREYWIYDGKLWLERPETRNLEILVHYIHSGNGDYGIKLYDADTISKSSMVNGSYLTDRNSASASQGDNSGMDINNSSDFTVTLMDMGASVGVMKKGQNNDGSGFFYYITASSPREIWLFKGKMFESMDELNDANQPGNLAILSADDSNNWTSAGQIKIMVQAQNGDTTDCQIAIRMANPVTSTPQLNGALMWDPHKALSLGGVDGDTIYVNVKGLPEGTTGDIVLQFDSANFQLLEAYVV